LGATEITASRADGKLKSRGLSASVTAENTPKFERAWDQYLDVLRQAGSAVPEQLRRRQDIPAVTVQPNVLIGLRLAYHWNQPWLAGTWTSNEKFLKRRAARGESTLARSMSFEWGNKRDPYNIELRDRCVVTQPMMGDRDREGIYREPMEFGKPDDIDDPSQVRTYLIDDEEVAEDEVFEGQPDWYSVLPEEG
jgi:hypothetical protein